jgi:hypothetical protein
MPKIRPAADIVRQSGYASVHAGSTHNDRPRRFRRLLEKFKWEV